MNQASLQYSSSLVGIFAWCICIVSHLLNPLPIKDSVRSHSLTLRSGLDLLFITTTTAAITMKPEQEKDQKGEKRGHREELSPPNTPTSRPTPNKMTKSEEVSLSDVIGELLKIRGSIERLEQSMEARMTAVKKDVMDMKVSMEKMSDEVTEIVREEVNRENYKMKSKLNEIKMEAKKLEDFRADAQEHSDKKDSVIVMGVEVDDEESE